jgi:hypothetical protein
MKIYTENKVEQYVLDKVRIYRAYKHHHVEIDHVQNREVHHVVVDQLLKHQDDLFVFQ